MRTCPPAWPCWMRGTSPAMSSCPARLIEGVRRQWRTGIRSLFGELVEETHARWRRCGEIAHRAEPDLKLGRGGLRDLQLLDALAIAHLADRLTVGRPENPLGSLTDAHLTLLNVRTELHRVSGRGHDLVLAQFADEISAALHIGDRFDLSRMLSDAGRTISYRVDAGLRTAGNALPRRGISAIRRRPRRPLDEGVVEYDGEIVLARDARPQSDPMLLLRVAAASASHRTADCGVHAEPAGRLGGGTPDAVAARGVGQPLGPAGRRPGHDSGHRNARPHRVVGPPFSGMGRDPRPSASRRHPYLDGRPPFGRGRLPSKDFHYPGGSSRLAAAGCIGARPGERTGCRPQRARR